MLFSWKLLNSLNPVSHCQIDTVNVVDDDVVNVVVVDGDEMDGFVNSQTAVIFQVWWTK